jgi:hypothetical protein
MVDSEPPKPWRTGKPPEELSLTGKVFPWEGDAPVFLELPGSPHLWLPCFTDPSQLRAFLERGGITHDRVKHIDEQWEFLDSFPRKDGDKEIRFMVDPFHTPQGTVRYKELLVS